MYHDVNRDIDLTLEELEEALAFDDERRHDEAAVWEACERASVQEAIAGGAKLRVRRVEDAFEIVLRLRNTEKSRIVLRCRLNKGGLFTGDGSVIYYPYEFSMQKYQHDTEMRAATEYVRRKLAKLGA
jgi:hypothetical protein